MGQVFSAIVPIFLIIGFGVFLKAKAGFDDAFWRLIEKLTFNGLIPTLLFMKIAEARIDWADALPITGIIVAGITLTALAAIPLRKLLGLSPERFVAVFQGGFRPNAYVGIAVVLGILGDKATGALAITLFVVAITINLLGVWGHLKWLPREGRQRGWRGIALDSIKNPLILACLLGGLLNATGWGLPPLIGPTLDLLRRAALPMGLMAVGAALSIAAVKDAGLPVLASCACKLLVQPTLTFGLGTLFGLEGYALLVPVIFAALPTSSTAYVVSRRMGSDPEVMAAIVTATHLGAIITLPVLLALIH